MPRGLVIGTAGHIDHGKTSLVRALTGIDTDRLAEEKRRGISIDLGFAHLTLASGETIAFVDVPGHERFVHNMLAGAAGIEAVLLVVAADESVKPQTREHFDICRLLGLRRGLIVLTKADRASAQQIEITKADIRRLVAGSFLADAPCLAVSALSGEGLTELKARLAELAGETHRDPAAIPRLFVDRSFSLKGFGSIVTGTLWGGTLTTGSTVQIHPLQRLARIRGLQSHGKQVEQASSGERVAVNLTGIDHTDIRRGFVLTRPDTLAATNRAGVTLEWLADVDVPLKRTSYLFYLGASEVVASVKVLDRSAGLAQIEFEMPVVALPGDRFVLRRPSPSQTVAGGTMIDAFPPVRINRSQAISRFGTLLRLSPLDRLPFLASESPGGVTASELARATGISPEQILASPGLVAAADRIVSKQWVESRRRTLVEWLSVYHREHPANQGAPVTQARLGVEAALAELVFSDFPVIRRQADMISLATHQAQRSPQEAIALNEIENTFRQAAFQPPSQDELLISLGLKSQGSRALLETLIKEGRLIRISTDLIFHRDAIGQIRQSLVTHKGRRFSVPEFKSWTQVSRKYAIPLLEYLDRQRITKREGDVRLVL